MQQPRPTAASPAQRCRNADSPSTQIWGGCEQILVQSMLIPSQGVLIGVQQCEAEDPSNGKNVKEMQSERHT